MSGSRRNQGNSGTQDGEYHESNEYVSKGRKYSILSGFHVNPSQEAMHVVACYVYATTYRPPCNMELKSKRKHRSHHHSNNGHHNMSDDSVPIRKDIRKLSQQEKDNLVRAFDAICKLPADNEDSFYQIASLHGEPFRGAGYSNPSWWGGYCNHGNILFPTWHRAYLYRLETALRNQVPGVTLPYWNELDAETTSGSGVPEIFLTETYKFADGTSIPNPLRSYTYQKTIVDRLVTVPDTDFTKPKGMKTTRFPYSSLYGEADSVSTQSHNSRMDGLGIEKTNQYLNDNIKAWLADPAPGPANPRSREGMEAGVVSQYFRCLRVPNYVVFSNTTSSARWNDENVDTPNFSPVVSLETPHNAIHVAFGGVQVPGPKTIPVPEARGDMGENETASFDPVFYFHHAYVDLVFWQWQLLHNQTEELIIEPQLATYPGTNSVDGQGPTPGVQGNIWLTLDSPLDPFKSPDDSSRAMTSKVRLGRDVVDTRNLGYIYQLPGQELGQAQKAEMPVKLPPGPQIVISGINRGAISGSFSVSAWALDDKGNPSQMAGIEPILSRWHVSGCANCQSHLEVRAHLPLEGWSNEKAEKTKFRILVHTRDHPEGLTEVGGKTPRWEIVASRQKRHKSGHLAVVATSVHRYPIPCRCVFSPLAPRSMDVVGRLRREIAQREAELVNLRSQLAATEEGPHPNGPLTGDEFQRYSRQMIVPGFGLGAQLRLKQARVLVVGAGGLGCPAAAYLAGAGVGVLGLVDADVVEVSNLHRQVAHSTERVGVAKVVSAIAYLRQLNPVVSYRGHDQDLSPHNARAIVSQYDVVLDCTDHPAARYLISDACVLFGKPLVSASAFQLSGQLTVLNNPPGRGPCYRCVFPRPPPPETVVGCGEGGILGPVVGTMGVLQALEAITLIAGGGLDPSSSPPPPQPRMLLLSASSSSSSSSSAQGWPEFRSVRLRGRRDDCFACSAGGGLTLQHLESSMDYVTFCGVAQPVSLLKPEERVSVDEYQRKCVTQPNHVLIDVRAKEHFSLGSMPGAINVPVHRFSQSEDVAELLRPIDRPGVPIYVVCRVGNDSQTVARKLKDLGMHQDGKRFVGDIVGGIKAWTDAVNPTLPFV
ncbi:hypothetical protein L249_8627 [Ophiocordyceps polyrhachis-furcata BCC 54312]|uniref:Adenylyltransferase and sulfurtransferase uba4 n=1 Tax=Ophiocordyceps polyrhachis-furcata BCC 54312 TaxID=1330021 RepID=A0A367L6W3_9HYPO|nr:hypothetical protein L249_8627 [Ophiocordyceps polyrhachis-furcata BCC 54312]